MSTITTNETALQAIEDCFRYRLTFVGEYDSQQQRAKNLFKKYSYLPDDFERKMFFFLDPEIVNELHKKYGIYRGDIYQTIVYLYECYVKTISKDVWRMVRFIEGVKENLQKRYTLTFIEDRFLMDLWKASLAGAVMSSDMRIMMLNKLLSIIKKEGTKAKSRESKFILSQYQLLLPCEFNTKQKHSVFENSYDTVWEAPVV